MRDIVLGIIRALNTDEGVPHDVYMVFYDMVKVAINEDAALCLARQVNATDGYFYLKGAGSLDVDSLIGELYSYAVHPVKKR